MANYRIILATLLIAVAFGVLLGLQPTLPASWQRALLAALAFAFLGGLISLLSARHRR